MSDTPEPSSAPAPLPRSVRAMGIYLLDVAALGMLFWALGLPEPWTLATQWASAIVLVLMAVALGMGLLASVLS